MRRSEQYRKRAESQSAANSLSSSDAKHQVSSDAAPRGCAAALVKFNASATAKKYRRCSSSTAQFYHAEKACSTSNMILGELKTRRRIVM
jgi:hypothetical protein